jgi:hypothetical protein
MTKIAGSGSISQRHGSADPDPHQNVIDPQHWLQCVRPVTKVVERVQRGQILSQPSACPHQVYEVRPISVLRKECRSGSEFPFLCNGWEHYVPYRCL